MFLEHATVRALATACLAVLAPSPGGAREPAGGLDGPARAALAAAHSEWIHRVTRAGDDHAWQAESPLQRMRSSFTARGVALAGGEGQRAPWNLSLALEAWGREGALEPLAAAEPEVQGRRVAYRRGPLTEWYVNASEGLEQGFTLECPPPGPRDGSLWLVLSIGGDLTGEVLIGGRDARFAGAGGGPVLHYTGLRAWDAAERELAASLAIAGSELRIRIEDQGAVYPVLVDPWLATEEAKLSASDAAADDLFGSSVAVWGDTAVVGADGDDLAVGNNAGSAHVFVRSGATWSEQAKLTASDAAGSDHFGTSVAVSADTIVVGAPNDDHTAGNAGSAYVFVRSGTAWSEQQKLTASDTAGGDLFGNSVAVWGDTAVVGAHLDNNAGGTDAGSAYVFTRSGTTWSEQQKLTASDAATSDVFGWSVALWDDTAVVGAHGDDIASGVNGGAAYVFVRSGSSWSEETKLVPSNQHPNANFGWSVAVADDTAIAAAHQENHPGLQGVGAAYVFVRNASSWSEQQRLIALDAAAGDAFGHSVALAGDVAVVGTPFDDHAGGGSAGSAYVFVRGGTFWCQQAKLTASDATSSDQLGWSVALSGDTAVAGANEDDPAGQAEAGSAYAFRLAPGSFLCTAGTSASGCQATLSMAGTASASLPSGFTLMAADVEGAKDGLFFFGTNGFQANSWGNGTSYQCIVPPVKRAGVLIGTGTSGQCDGAFAQDLNALWCPTCPGSGKNPGASAVVQAQLWYRDPLSTSNQTTSLSDAIEFCVAP